jgi:hypothetical protein
MHNVTYRLHGRIEHRTEDIETGDLVDEDTFDLEEIDFDDEWDTEEEATDAMNRAREAAEMPTNPAEQDEIGRVLAAGLGLMKCADGDDAYELPNGKMTPRDIYLMLAGIFYGSENLPGE